MARGDMGGVLGGSGGWARVKSGFVFPILYSSMTVLVPYYQAVLGLAYVPAHNLVAGVRVAC